jgi:hypothetical protein
MRPKRNIRYEVGTSSWFYFQNGKWVRHPDWNRRYALDAWAKTKKKAFKIANQLVSLGAEEAHVYMVDRVGIKKEWKSKNND